MRYRIVIEKVERHEVYLDSDNAEGAKTQAKSGIAGGKIILTVPLRILSIKIVNVHRSD